MADAKVLLRGGPHDPPQECSSGSVSIREACITAQADIQELNQDYTLLLEEFDIKIKRLEVINEHTSERYAQYLKSLNTKNISK